MVWITRCPEGVPPFKPIPGDSLYQRRELFAFGNSLASNRAVSTESFEYRCGVDVTGIHEIPFKDGPSKIRLTLTKRPGQGSGETGKDVDEILVDHVYSNCGYRPNTDMTRELQVHYCWESEGPMSLAGAMLSASGGGRDCLSQVVPGAETLRNPEPKFYVVGMKSYGRGTAFLMRVGYEQIENVTTLLGDEL